MKFGDTNSNEIAVEVAPGETLHLGAEYLRSPRFSRSTIPHFWTGLLPDALFGRLFAGKLWDLYVHVAPNSPAEQVLLGGNEPKGRFLVIEVEPRRKLFVRLSRVAAYTFEAGGGFYTSCNVFSPSRWILKAVSAVMIRGPATLIFYGVDLKPVELKAGQHSFSDQLLAFDATAAFQLHGLLPEGHDPAAHGINITSTTVDVEFLSDTTVVKQTTRERTTNRLTRLWRLLFLGLLGGWLFEKAVMSPPVASPTPLSEVAFTGKVINCDFPLGDFKPRTLGNTSLEAMLARRVDSVGLERLALVQGTRAMWMLPSLTNDQLYDDPDGSLVTLFETAYGSIARDPGFEDVRSSMPWCLAGVGVDKGDGFVFIPASRMSDQSGKDPAPAIVFLHGYGGSLLWNLWALKESFPDYAIVMPSGGIAWADQDPTVVHQYLTAMIDEVQSRHAIRLDTPWLVALSQGGPTGFRLASARPEAFRGFVGIATAPEAPETLATTPGFPILMVNGDKDERVGIATAVNGFTRLKDCGANIQLKTLAEADHFFFLSQPETTEHVIRAFFREQSTPTLAQGSDTRTATDAINTAAENIAREAGAQVAAEIAAARPTFTQEDLVGRYKGWRPSKDNRTIWFYLRKDGTFRAEQTPDNTKISEGLGMVTKCYGHWHVHDGRLTVAMDAVLVLGVWVSSERTWINDARIRSVSDDRVELEGYNDLLKETR